ncbi:MAG: response regulator [Polyangiaceae bacterium]|nr:response regulator [Polyangiaceae bacterium]
MHDETPLLVVVNDNTAARYLLSRILRSVGWRVEEAETGLDGLRLVHELSPEVVVLDVKLPDLIGYEVCRRIKSDPATAGISVIQTSATFVTSEGKARGLDSGADAYLAQPFESVELVAMVKSLLRLRKSEAAARQRADALGLADRRKDEFLAMLAHELRNPLSAMLIASSLLERGDGPPEELGKLAQTIGRQTRHLARLVDDLLDVARVTRGKIQISRTALDLTRLVETVVAAQRPNFDKLEVGLDIELPTEPIHVDGDATRIEQAVINILTNAAKFSSPGARVEVCLTKSGADEQESTTFRVRDHGIGLSSESLKAVWDLFYQADVSLARPQSGLGIGLTMVKSIVELHGGRVSVASKGPGEGAEFSFELPTVPSPAVEESTRRSDPAGADHLSLLLVDDNVDSCELHALAFRKAGHATTCAHDGLAGISLALEQPFDVAIIDIGLPGVDGYEVARRLRQKLDARCPYMIALTGYGRPEDRDRALDAGFDEHLVKPVDIDRVEKLIRQVGCSIPPPPAPASVH